MDEIGYGWGSYLWMRLGRGEGRTCDEMAQG